MKLLRSILLFVLLSQTISSCTKVDIDEETNYQENVQAWGDDDEILEELDKD
jgi:hypothetical protein